MLISLTVTNFRSYASAQTLDLGRRTFIKNRPTDDDWTANIHSRAAIFGANASGKTGILASLLALAHAVRNSIESGDALNGLSLPHALQTDEPTNFVIDFVANNVRYEWTLTLDRRKIQEEALRACPQSHWRQIYRRQENNIEFGASSKIPAAAKAIIKQFATSTALTMSAFLKVNDPGPVHGAAEWWQRIGGGTGAPYRDSNLGEKLTRQAWSDAAVEVLSLADIGVSDVELRPHPHAEEAKSFNLEVGEDGSVSVQPAQGKPSVPEVLYFTHTDGEAQFVLPEWFESDGSLAWFNLMMTSIQALAHGWILVIDELDTSLHPHLLREFVGYFGDPDLNQSGAQLIFATHDTNLLSNMPARILEPSEVWFVEKNHAESELYSLAEFAVKRDQSVERRYLNGAYGAVPIPGRNALRKAVSRECQEALEGSDG